VTGLIYDLTGSYTGGFAAGIIVCAVSGLSVWRAAPGKVRAVAGRRHRPRPAANVA
jgi:hypothetical protein